MGDMNTELDVTAEPTDGRAAVASPLTADTPRNQPTASPTPDPPPKESAQHSDEPATTKPIAVVDKTSYQNLKAGDTDPLVGVVIKEVIIKADTFIVYIDQDLILRWHWNGLVDANHAAPIFNRAGELQAKSEFLRQTRRQRDLMSARRLIGEGLVVMFCTPDLVYANAALDTGREIHHPNRDRDQPRLVFWTIFFLLCGICRDRANPISARPDADHDTTPHLLSCRRHRSIHLQRDWQ